MRGQQLVFGLPSEGDEFVQAVAHVDRAATVELGIGGSGPGRKGEVGLKAPASEPIAAALHPS
jgi:hypothetical protein